VVVIGAGLAGLHAALQLQAAGVPVVVLEARGRAGGRVHTLDQVPGKPEGGANTIGPNYGRLISTAAHMGVPLLPQGRGEAMGLVLGGQRIDREGWPASPLNTLPDHLKAITPDRLGSSLLRENPLTTSWSWRSDAAGAFDQSAETFYRSKGLGDAAIAWLDANNSYGNRLADTSMLSLFRVSASIGRAISMRQPALEVAGGNARLPGAMAAALQQEVKFGEQVVAIRQRPGGLGDVRVECASGRVWQAPMVICSLPLPALKNIRFEPGLDALQREAVYSVAYHKVTQGHLLASHAYWADAGEPASWWTDGPLGRVFTRAPGQGQPANITCWVNGEACARYDALPSADAGQLMLDDFLQLVPAARGHVQLAAMVSWQQEAFSGGSWAIWKPGEIARYADALSRPHRRVLFAGEHTAWSNSGMEGAMESGERAALQALRVLA
jgi:monoamine oxidase